jgi:hypothetical protein
MFTSFFVSPEELQNIEKIQYPSNRSDQDSIPIQNRQRSERANFYKVRKPEDLNRQRQ